MSELEKIQSLQAELESVKADMIHQQTLDSDKIEAVRKENQKLREWKSKVLFLWSKYKRAKGDITKNQSSVEQFENLLNQNDE